MKLIIIDRKAWERHRSDFAEFIHRIELLIGLPYRRGGVQPITTQHTHVPRVQKCRNASFLQNRRKDTLQTKRHTSHARKALLSNTKENVTNMDEKSRAVLEQALRDMGI